MCTILSTLQSEYAKTRWPFFRSVEVFNRFGAEAKDELNRLSKEGCIKKRESNTRFPLIQILVDEDGCVIQEP